MLTKIFLTTLLYLVNTNTASPHGRSPHGMSASGMSSHTNHRPDCSLFTCGATCQGECGWSSLNNRCQYGSTTRQSEMNKGPGCTSTPLNVNSDSTTTIDTVSTTGETTSTTGETTSTTEESTSKTGESTSTTEESTSTNGESTSTTGESTSTTGESTSTIGESTSTTGESTNTIGESTSFTKKSSTVGYSLIGNVFTSTVKSTIVASFISIENETMSSYMLNEKETESSTSENVSVPVAVSLVAIITLLLGVVVHRRRNISESKDTVLSNYLEDEETTNDTGNNSYEEPTPVNNYYSEPIEATYNLVASIEDTYGFGNITPEYDTGEAEYEIPINSEAQYELASKNQYSVPLKNSKQNNLVDEVQYDLAGEAQYDLAGEAQYDLAS